MADQDDASVRQTLGLILAVVNEIAKDVDDIKAEQNRRKYAAVIIEFGQPTKRKGA